MEYSVNHETYYNWISGEAEIYPDTQAKIERYLSSDDAQALLAEGQTYLSLADCAKLTETKAEKIRSLCATGVIDAKRSAGNRWFANIDSLRGYLRLSRPSKPHFESIPNSQALSFGELWCDFKTTWKPMLSAHNDFEIFNPERHEYINQYWISNNGYIYNSTTRKLKGTEPDQDGYIHIKLEKNSADGSKMVTQYIHRLVAYYFCPNRQYKDYVHHINGNKQDNRATNLLWVTHEEHTECHRLKKKDRKEYYKYVQKIKRENKW